MAKKRTKKDKIQAKTHRSIPNEVMQTGASMHLEIGEEITPKLDATTLLGYPTKLLYRDLARSLAISVLLVVLLVGIFLIVRYN